MINSYGKELLQQLRFENGAGGETRTLTPRGTGT